MSTSTAAPLATSHDLQARDQFRLMPQDQQVQVIRRLAAVGHGDETISRATGLAVEFVRELLDEGSRA